MTNALELAGERCLHCGRGVIVTLPGQAPRCSWCDRTVGLAPAELNVKPYVRQIERQRAERQLTPEQRKERRRQAQERMYEQAAKQHRERPVSMVRERLDLRLGVDERDQLNDLIRLYGVTASEVIRRAVEAMWDAECG